jgi:hypothetical protein
MKKVVAVGVFIGSLFISAAFTEGERIERNIQAAGDSLNIKFQFRGNCYAYSSPKNAIPSNGEAHSDNLPKKVGGQLKQGKFYLYIDIDRKVVFEKGTKGCMLYLVNTTDSMVELNASDSRLYIVAEALTESGKWKPISYLPSSGCGNSYHIVKLDKQEYWEFPVYVFKGNFKTKLRYTLTINGNHKISSNQMEVFINKEQFDPEKKQGHSPLNLMDPYAD